MAFQASWLQEQLGRELRKSRENSGLSTREVGDALGWAHTKVARIERAENQFDQGDIVRLGRHYRIADQEIERLCRMAAAKVTDAWWERYKQAVGADYFTLIRYENDASRMQSTQPSVVHGLLQTHDYLVNLIGLNLKIKDPDTIDSLIEVRLLRQRRLTGDEPPLLDVTLAESVFHTPFGGTAVLHEQLRSLRESAELPNIAIRVLPDTALVARLPLDLYEFGGEDEPAIAASETPLSTVTYDSPLHIRKARRILRTAQEAALSPEDSITYIERRISETRGQ